jgi:carbon-monoxide dehydrogenase medium subunit
MVRAKGAAWRPAPLVLSGALPDVTERQAMWQAYEIPTSVEGALDILARYGGQARLIAGGTDLVIELQEGKHSAECLVDVTRIPGLDRIERQDDWIVLGCNVTFRQIKESPLLREQARVLSEAAATVGALQIQTVATLAGNVVNAMPAADGSVALVTLDAEAEIADGHGRTWRPVGDLFRGPGESAVDPRRQMLTAFRFRAAGPGQGSAWERIGRRRALVLPILNCGVSVALTSDGERLEWARIGLGPVAPVPFRARQAEAFLAGRPATEEAFVQAAEIAAGEAQPRSSLLRASREYRVEVLKVLVRHGLARAVAQAQEHAS